MAVIRPFKALRPTKEKAHIVASVPYDVVNRKEAKEQADGNPLNFLRVTRSEIELEDSVSQYSEEVYRKAKNNLDQLTKETPLINNDKPHFYLYRLEMNGKAQVGIAATFSINDYEKDVILKHEKTRREKEDDRTKHIITTEAQTGVVFLTYRGVASVNNIVSDTIRDNEPEYDFTADDGIKHTVWVVPDKYNDKIVEEFGKIKHLYIADGHHRAASAARARNVKKEQNKYHTGKEEYNYFISVIFPADQLNILPYNRVVSDLNNLSKEEFLNRVNEKFIVEKSEKKKPSTRKNYGMYLDGEWYMLKARDNILASSSLSKSISETLDVSILQDFLLNPILNIDDPRTNKRIDFIGGIRGTGELEKLVDSGKAAVAFSLFPVSLDDLMNISDAGEIMPPKSTWFEPKLRDGLLIHKI